MSLETFNFFPVFVRRAEGAGRLSLAVLLEEGGPDISGQLDITNARVHLAFLQNPIKPFSMRLVFSKERILLENFGGPSGRGSLSVAGSAFLRKGRVEDLDLRLLTDMARGLSIDLDAGDLKSRGGVRADVFIKGDPNSPEISGRISVHDNNFTYMEDSGPSNPDLFTKRIHWNLEVTALERVNYVYNLINALVKPQSRIMLRNRINDYNFSIEGRLDVSRGIFDYLNQEYRIQSPTYVEFRPKGHGFDAILNFRGSMKIRDAEGEDVTVYLGYSGPIDQISPVYSSDPPMSQDELMMLVGVENISDESLEERLQQSLIGRSTELFTLLGLRYVTSDVRRALGLDMLSIRSPVFRYLYERESMDTLDPKRRLSVWRDTEFSMGKYLTDFMFV